MESISPYLATVGVAIVVAQVTRWVWNQTTGQASWRDFICNYGHLVTHQAAVVSLAAAALTVAGWNSSSFGLTAVYALVIGLLTHRLKTEAQLGRQLLIGSGVGLIVGLLATFDYWQDDLSRALAAPADIAAASGNWLLGFALVLLAGELLVIWLRFGKIRQLPTSRRLLRAVRLSLNGPAILGLLAAWLLRIEAPGFTNLAWLWLLVAVIAVLSGYFAATVYRSAPARLKEEARHFRGQPGTRPAAAKSRKKR